VRTVDNRIIIGNIIGGQDIVVGLYIKDIFLDQQFFEYLTADLFIFNNQVTRRDSRETVAKIHFPPVAETIPFECSIGFQDALSESVSTCEKALVISIALVYV